MNYVRTSSGGMMPVTFKSSPPISDKKQTVAVKPLRKSKKGSPSASK